MPPAIPQIALPNPHFRKPSLSTSLATEDSLRNSFVEVPVPVIPEEHKREELPSPPLSPSLHIGQAVTTESPINGIPQIQFPPSASASYTPKHFSTRGSVVSPHPGSYDSGYNSSSPQNGKSPVVPIRSMFPTYNSTVPLTQQHYYPQRPIPAITRSIARSIHQDYASPVYPPSIISPGPGSIANFPLDSLTPHISSPKELDDLWEATHGMEPNSRIKSYDLELARTEEANFTLGSDPTRPFYSLITYDTNEIAISKISPRKETITCEVAINTIESAARRAPPNDGLVTFIFPKMAAMLAINQSTELAKQHGLAPTHRDEVQAAAVRRAADQEASRLRWNASGQHYELDHPALGRRVRGPDFAKSPQSGIAPSSTFGARPVLDIHVSSPTGRTLPTITVTNPKSSDPDSATSPSIQGIKMTNLAQIDTDSSLLILDFNTRIMHVNANLILELVPSLFAIDSIVSAVMTVAIADEHTNPVLAGMELWQPKPSRAMSTFGGSVAGKSTAGSVFYATVAERDDAEEEARALAEMHENDVKRNKTGSKAHKKWFSSSSKQKQPKSKKKQIVMREFDLEKLGHYQAGDRKGQELPGVVRLILSVMVGGLRFFVWFLTLIVHFLSWILVTVTRGVTSEKF